MLGENVRIYDLVQMGLVEIIDRKRPNDAGIGSVGTGDVVV
jgi:hypothetical protein